MLPSDIPLLKVNDTSHSLDLFQDQMINCCSELFTVTVKGWKFLYNPWTTIAFAFVHLIIFFQEAVLKVK